jgi:TolA-binding protein
MTGGMQSGIITRVYKSGSIIYFENDKSEFIYILKSGRVLLTYTKIDTGEEIKEDVRQGEFFGVKSALGKYPREETAQTIGETVVLVLTLADFERLILKNVNVVRKMLRVFSNQLRRIGKTVRTVLGESDSVAPDVELFRIGEHYYKAGDYTKASYAFKRYMEYYPDTDYAKVAMDRIKSISSGNVGMSSSGSKVVDSSDSDFDDFSMDDSSDDMFSIDSDNSAGNPPSDDFTLSSELSSEMDDFITDSDDSIDDFGDFSFDEPEQEKSSGMKDRFDEGVGHFEMDNFNDALEIFREIIDDGEPAGDYERKFFIDSYFYMGRSFFELKKYKDAMTYLAEIVKKYQDSENFKASLFYIGEIFNAAKQKEKALSYYNRVLNMTPKDALNSKALDKIKVLQKS